MALSMGLQRLGMLLSLVLILCWFAEGCCCSCRSSGTCRGSKKEPSKFPTVTCWLA